MATVVPDQIFYNMGKAASLTGLSRYQLWKLAKDFPGQVPILFLGGHKRLVHIAKLVLWLERTFGYGGSAACASPLPAGRRPRGRPRKVAPAALAAGAEGGVR